MMVEIYTPGHNYLTDTLIMWGISYIAIDACDPYNSKVLGFGGRYKIILKEYNSDNFNIRLREILTEIREGNRFNRGFDSDTRNGIIRTIDRILDELNERRSINIPDIFEPEHIKNNSEGRFKRRSNLIRLYLPLSAIYGKYRTYEYKYIEEPYFVCNYCLLFSSIGIISAAGIVQQRGNAIYNVLGFEGEISLYYLSRLFRPISWFTESMRILQQAFNYDASLTKLGQLFTCYLEIPRNIRRELPKIHWYMFLYSYDIGKTKRISSYQMIDLAPIIYTIDKIEEEYYELPRLIEILLTREEIIDKGGDAVVNLLGELSFNRDINTVYKILRVLRSIITNTEDEDLRNIVNNSLAKGLLKAIE